MPHLLFESAVRAALIAAATAAVLLGLRVRSAAARHTAWLGVVLWMLLLPVCIAWLPQARLPLLPAAPLPAAATATALPASGPAELSAPDFAPPRPTRPAWTWPSALLLLYGLGAGLLLARLAIGIARAHRLIRTARAHEGFWISGSCAAPVTVGWLRPRILLPEAWHDWPPDQLAAVLAHEQEHARRRDPLRQLFALLNRTLFWFHPLSWWLERRLSALAEEACDAAALAHGHDPHDYTRYLLDIARAVERSGMRIGALGMAMPGSALPRRIRQILSTGPAQPVPRVRALIAASVCLLVSALFAAGALVPERPPMPLLPLIATAVPESPAVPTPAPVPAAPRPAPAQAPAPAPQTANHRLIVLYFQVPVMNSDEQVRAVSAASRFISAQLQPDDRVAVMTCCAVRVLQDFTPDTALLLQALNLVPTGAPAQQDPAAAGTLDDLQTAVKMLSPMPGKKALLYFSKVVPRSQPSVQSVIDAAVLANVAFYPIDVSGLVQQLPAKQAPAPDPEFEAASVKPAASDTAGPRGVWSPDPGRVTGRAATLGEIVRFAYGLRPYRVVAPAWLEEARYNLDAATPAPATPDQLRRMMQALLVQRFRLAVHREQKELTVNEMTIAASGPKMPAAADARASRPPAGADYTSMHVGSAEAFARTLSNSHPNDPPIIDKTGLKGSYQFVLSLQPGDNLASALEQQLGLKLTPAKTPTEILVVDHAERMPVAN